MTLINKTFVSGQLNNNICLLYDDSTRDAVIIDPSFDTRAVLEFVNQNKLKIESIWMTHGHFDHFAGISYLQANLPARPKVGLHPADLDLWLDGGGSKEFHVVIEFPEKPDFFITEGEPLSIGDNKIEVRLSPGHTHGSVIFYSHDLQTAICGDVIFHHSIGRTDLSGGSYSTLMKSIRSQIFTLPPETILIPGHGEETTVKEEMQNNPFLNLPFEN